MPDNALFIDIENFVPCAERAGLEPDIVPLVAHLQRIGTLRLIRSVGNIPAIQRMRSAKWITLAHQGGASKPLLPAAYLQGMASPDPSSTSDWVML